MDELPNHPLILPFFLLSIHPSIQSFILSSIHPTIHPIILPSLYPTIYLLSQPASQLASQHPFIHPPNIYAPIYLFSIRPFVLSFCHPCIQPADIHLSIHPSIIHPTFIHPSLCPSTFSFTKQCVCSDSELDSEEQMTTEARSQWQLTVKNRACEVKQSTQAAIKNIQGASGTWRPGLKWRRWGQHYYIWWPRKKSWRGRQKHKLQSKGAVATRLKQ